MFDEENNFYFLLNFNWRITALQCCLSFCRTTAWIHVMYAWTRSLLSLPPTPPSPPRSSQSIGLSSLCCRAASRWPSLSHVVLCIYPPKAAHRLRTPICSLCLRLHRCPANRCISIFISTVFLIYRTVSDVLWNALGHGVHALWHGLLKRGYMYP